MRLLIFILSALLVSCIAAPFFEPEPHPGNEWLVEAVKMFKDPQTYLRYKKLSEALEGNADLSDLSDDHKAYVHFQMMVLATFEKEKRVQMAQFIRLFYDLPTATVVDGAKPTKEQLADLAKRVSKAARENRWILREQLAITGDNNLMTNETIDLLKEIMEQNPLKESDNIHMEILHKKIPRLYSVTRTIKAVEHDIKDSIKAGDMTWMELKTAKKEGGMNDFRTEFMTNEALAILGSEEAADEIIKNFAVITDTIRTASSYESLQALYNALARSKRLEAYAILVREIAKCAVQPLTSEEKAQLLNHFGKILEFLKFLLADGEDTSKFPALLIRFENTDMPAMESLFRKLGAAAETEKGIKQFSQCLVTKDDRRDFKDALALSDPVFTDPQLGVIRQKNEKVYALIHNLNGIVKVVRERQGLGAEADSFLKEMVTMPNSLLRIADFFSPSQETLSKISSHKKAVIDKFNSLSGRSKKEFVGMFPYRTVINLALLG